MEREENEFDEPDQECDCKGIGYFNSTHVEEGMTCNCGGILMGKSIRKPHNQDAGYIASLRSGLNKGFVVIYDAEKQGLSSNDGKYAIVCQTHNQIVNTTSLPKARESMKSPDFCSGCN